MVRYLFSDCRQFNTESAPTSTATTAAQEAETRAEKMSAIAQLRNLTSSQLKALNQFSKYIVKSAYEQGITVALNKEWVRLVQRLPPTLSEEQNNKNNATAVQDPATVDSPVVQKITETLNPVEIKASETSGPAASSTFSGYSIPQVLSNLKLNFSTTSKQNADAAQLAIPQWKIKQASTVPKVGIFYRYSISTVRALATSHFSTR